MGCKDSGEDIGKDQSMTREIIVVDQIKSAGRSLDTTDVGLYILNMSSFTVLSKQMRDMVNANEIYMRLVKFPVKNDSSEVVASGTNKEEKWDS